MAYDVVLTGKDGLARHFRIYSSLIPSVRSVDHFDAQRLE